MADGILYTLVDDWGDGRLYAEANRTRPFPPLALSRLGYDVVGCKRYSSYGTAFDENVRLLERSGVHVVSTERERELDQISGVDLFEGTTASSLRRR